MTSKIPVRLLTEARLQLRDIAAYYKMKVGPSSARQITGRILDALDKLGDFPQMGMVPPSRPLAEAGYRVLIIDEHLCFYRVADDTVFVTHIVHAKSDYIKKIFI